MTVDQSIVTPDGGARLLGPVVLSNAAVGHQLVGRHRVDHHGRRQRPPATSRPPTSARCIDPTGPRDPVPGRRRASTSAWPSPTPAATTAIGNNSGSFTDWPTRTVDLGGRRGRPVTIIGAARRVATPPRLSRLDRRQRRHHHGQRHRHPATRAPHSFQASDGRHRRRGARDQHPGRRWWSTWASAVANTGGNEAIGNDSLQASATSPQRPDRPGRRDRRRERLRPGDDTTIAAGSDRRVQHAVEPATRSDGSASVTHRRRRRPPATAATTALSQTEDGIDRRARRRPSTPRRRGRSTSGRPVPTPAATTRSGTSVRPGPAGQSRRRRQRNNAGRGHHRRGSADHRQQLRPASGNTLRRHRQHRPRAMPRPSATCSSTEHRPGDRRRPSRASGFVLDTQVAAVANVGLAGANSGASTSPPATRRTTTTPTVTSRQLVISSGETPVTTDSGERPRPAGRWPPPTRARPPTPPTAALEIPTGDALGNGNGPPPTSSQDPESSVTGLGGLIGTQVAGVANVGCRRRQQRRQHRHRQRLGQRLDPNGSSWPGSVIGATPTATVDITALGTTTASNSGRGVATRSDGHAKVGTGNAVASGNMSATNLQPGPGVLGRRSRGRDRHPGRRRGQHRHRASPTAASTRAVGQRVQQRHPAGRPGRPRPRPAGGDPSGAADPSDSLAPSVRWPRRTRVTRPTRPTARRASARAMRRPAATSPPPPDAGPRPVDGRRPGGAHRGGRGAQRRRRHRQPRRSTRPSATRRTTSATATQTSDDRRRPRRPRRSWARRSPATAAARRTRSDGTGKVGTGNATGTGQPVDHQLRPGGRRSTARWRSPPSPAARPTPVSAWPTPV